MPGLRRSLNILHVGTALTWRGGEAQILYLARGLAGMGHSVTVATPRKSVLYDKSVEAGIGVYAFAPRSELDIVAALRLARYIRKNNIHVLHMHDAHAHTIGVMAMKFCRPLITVLARRVDFRVAGNFLSRVKYRAPIDRIIAISEGVRSVLVDCGIPREKIELVYSGIQFPKEKYSPEVRREFGIAPSEKIVGIVAALAPHKDHENFLAAAAVVRRAHPAVRFMVVGDGELEEPLRARARELGIDDCVIFTGFRTDVHRIMAAFDVFVLSSYLEGLCTSILDAMALALPIVATDAGGIPELVINEKTGLLVPPRDSNALAGAITALLANTTRARALAKAAYAKVQHFSNVAMYTGTEKVYQRTIDEKFSRIVVRTPNWIGDAIMSTPFFAALREAWPAARITALAKPKLAEVYWNNPDVDDIITFHEAADAVASIKPRRFDLGIIMPDSFSSASLFWRARLPYRFGYRGDGRSFLLTNPQRKSMDDVTESYVGLANALGATRAAGPWRLFVSADEDRAIIKKMAGFGLSTRDTLVGVNPATAYGPSRIWPLERYAELARRMIAAHRAKVIVFTGPGEDSFADYFRNSCADCGKNLVVLGGEDRLSLREYMAVMSHLRAFVTNDTGPMHIALARGVPTVALFGSSDPEKEVFREHRAGNVLIHHTLPCSYCYDRTCESGRDYECLTGVSVDEVATAVDGLLRAKTKRRR